MAWCAHRLAREAAPVRRILAQALGRSTRSALPRARPKNAGAHLDARIEASPEPRGARVQPGDACSVRGAGERIARELLRGGLRVGGRSGERSGFVRGDLRAHAEPARYSLRTRG